MLGLRESRLSIINTLTSFACTLVAAYVILPMLALEPAVFVPAALAVPRLSVIIIG